MMTKVFLVGLLFVLPLWGAEEAFTLRGKKFRVVKCAPSEVRMVWRGEGGRPLVSFSQARRHLLSEGASEVLMLMNGGIFEPSLRPSGYYMARGKVERPLNLKAGKGNFFLKPNGVFFVKESGDGVSAGVVVSEEISGWSGEEQASLSYAVQSGPLLLRKGKTHPAFNQGSKNELRRNGVGVDAEGRVVFVITEDKTVVNLWTFADCFRQLGCQDALFLDGVISQMATNPEAGVKGKDFATIIGVVK